MSRSDLLVRLLGMKSTHNRAWMWLGGIVIGHLAISFIHGTAHARANISMSPAANLFVFGVILAGPLIGLALALWSRRVGAWVIGITLAASLVFGVVNHFVFASADHVAHVDPRWQPLFATTAVLLAITEALGAALAARVIRERSLT